MQDYYLPPPLYDMRGGYALLTEVPGYTDAIPSPYLASSTPLTPINITTNLTPSTAKVKMADFAMQNANFYLPPPEGRDKMADFLPSAKNALIDIEASRPKEEASQSFWSTTSSNGNTFSQELGLIIIGALIFIVSFMWKDFITDIEHVFISANPSMLARFIYIMVVTFIVIYLVVFLRNYLRLAGGGNQSALPTFDDSPGGPSGPDGSSGLDMGNGGE
jgi:hypothetical protein